VCDRRERGADVPQSKIGYGRNPIGGRQDVLHVQPASAQSRNDTGGCRASALIDDDETSGPRAPMLDRFKAALENRPTERRDHHGDVIDAANGGSHRRGAAINSPK
jgi:hypothetical protein